MQLGEDPSEAMTRVDPASEDWVVEQCDGLGDDRLERVVWCGAARFGVVRGVRSEDTVVTFAPTRGRGGGSHHMRSVFVRQLGTDQGG
jgi:hypothetical protein